MDRAEPPETAWLEPRAAVRAETPVAARLEPRAAARLEMPAAPGRAGLVLRAQAGLALVASQEAERQERGPADAAARAAAARTAAPAPCARVA